MSECVLPEFPVKGHTKDKSSYATIDSGYVDNQNVADVDSESGLDDMEDEAQTPLISPPYPIAPLHHRIIVHLQLMLLVFVGYVRFILLLLRIDTNNLAQERHKMKDFPSMYAMMDPVFTLFIIRRIRNIINFPVAGCPSSTVTIRERMSPDYGWTFRQTGKLKDVTNLGSYNYLGFSANGAAAKMSIDAIDEYGVSTGGISSFSLHSNHLHRELEKNMARFLNVDDAVVFPMGFGTNTMAVPSLVDAECLVLSDELNHASLIVGCKTSNATTKVFKHNDVKDCERKLLDALRFGNPKTKRPYSHILIIIEGLYSMEGTIPHLPKFVALKKRYSAYLMMDEAHSIGSMGQTGRGICEYWDVPHSDIDILMGTFTKSMAGAGGYVAGNALVIKSIRANSHSCYAPSMSPAVCQQVITALETIDRRDGRQRLADLRRNTKYFRMKLIEAGMIVIGNEHSPVVPVLLMGMPKIAEFSRQMLAMDIGVVVVSYPAIPKATERARFCLSSAHTKEQLDHAIKCIIQVADQLSVRIKKE